MSSSKFQDYPELLRLSSALQKHRLVLQVCPETDFERAYSLRRLEFKSGDRQFIIPIEDEFEDASRYPSQLMLLHLVLWSCGLYEDADDFTKWANNAGIPITEPKALQFYRELGEVVPHILQIIRDDAAALSTWDYTLNTGVTQALRQHYEENQKTG